MDLKPLAGYLRTWSATQRFVKARGSDPVADLERQLIRHWGDPQSVRTIAWPIALRLGLKSDKLTAHFNRPRLPAVGFARKAFHRRFEAEAESFQHVREFADFIVSFELRSFH